MAEQVRSMLLNKYSNLLAFGRWPTKYPKDSQILDLVGLAQNLMDDTNKLSEKANRNNN